MSLGSVQSPPNLAGVLLARNQEGSQIGNSETCQYYQIISASNCRRHVMLFRGLGGMESKGKGGNDPQDPPAESDDEDRFPDRFPLEATEHYAYWASATQFAHGAELPVSKASYGSGFMAGFNQGSRLKGLGQWRLTGFSALNKAIEDSEKYRKRLEKAPNPETVARFWWVVGYVDGFGFGYNGHTGGVLADSRDPATHGLPQPNRKSATGVVGAGYVAATLVGIIAVFSFLNGQNGAAAFGVFATLFLVWWVRHR